jgi:hypothetical protein
MMQTMGNEIYLRFLKGFFQSKNWVKIKNFTRKILEHNSEIQFFNHQSFKPLFDI